MNSRGKQSKDVCTAGVFRNHSWWTVARLSWGGVQNEETTREATASEIPG